MAKPETSDFSRPLRLADIPAAGLDVTVEATPAECAEIAALFDIPAVKALAGRFRVTRADRRAHVSGLVEGVVTRTCVVTLELFDETVREEVSADFSQDAEPLPNLDALSDADLACVGDKIDLDAPEAIIDGKIDLGTLTMEFLALGMDPYPRKPGAVFDPGPAAKDESPFAALARLKTSAD